MNEIALKYGCNPNQKPSRIYMADGSELPVNTGRSYIAVVRTENTETLSIVA